MLLSYRGKAFNRVKAKNRQDLDLAEQQQRCPRALWLERIGFTKQGATLKLADGRMRPVPVQNAFVLIGGDPPVKWLESIGIRYVQKPHSYQRGATDQLVERLLGRQVENNRPGQAVAPSYPRSSSLGPAWRRRRSSGHGAEARAQRSDDHGAQGSVSYAPAREAQARCGGPKVSELRR